MSGIQMIIAKSHVTTHALQHIHSRRKLPFTKLCTLYTARSNCSAVHTKHTSLTLRHRVHIPVSTHVTSKRNARVRNRTAQLTATNSTDVVHGIAMLRKTRLHSGVLPDAAAGTQIVRPRV